VRETTTLSAAGVSFWLRSPSFHVASVVLFTIRSPRVVVITQVREVFKSMCHGLLNGCEEGMRKVTNNLLDFHSTATSQHTLLFIISLPIIILYSYCVLSVISYHSVFCPPPATPHNLLFIPPTTPLAFSLFFTSPSRSSSSSIAPISAVLHSSPPSFPSIRTLSSQT
jgi:hypothetical protein